MSKIGDIIDSGGNTIGSIRTGDDDNAWGGCVAVLIIFPLIILAGWLSRQRYGWLIPYLFALPLAAVTILAVSEYTNQSVSPKGCLIFYAILVGVIGTLIAVIFPYQIQNWK